MPALRKISISPWAESRPLQAYYGTVAGRGALRTDSSGTYGHRPAQVAVCRGVRTRG